MRASFAAMAEGADAFACRPCSRRESESIRAAIGMRIFAKIGLHFVLICLVTLTPPLLYDRLAAAGVTDPLLQFSGALTYPPYIGYWIARIKHARIRITLFHLLSFVAVAGCCVVGLDSRGVNEIVPVLGVPIALLPSLILAIAMLFRRQMAVARSHLYSFLLLLPLALLVEYGILQAIALSAMRGLRY
ncbi:hypothetical protein ACYT85_19990 [Ralstonia solanacearum]|uniref:hypothetical protein n=1 Tax=Ralstonia solanacearum TaxID=305 RepID=UPI0007D783A1|nr:hypothetical protein [Ralstonia solanacearum]OAI59424.1 membrane protein [Ralstonia solanacearum]